VHGADACLTVLWAQRSSDKDEEKNIVYLSVNASDLESPKVDLSASGVTVEGVQKGTKATYKVSLEFYEDINVEVPHPSLSPLSPCVVLPLTIPERQSYSLPLGSRWVPSLGLNPRVFLQGRLRGVCMLCGACD
jgi:hypothetical protein